MLIKPKDRWARIGLVEAQDLEDGRASREAVAHDVYFRFRPRNKLPVQKDDPIFKHLNCSYEIRLPGPLRDSKKAVVSS